MNLLRVRAAVLLAGGVSLAALGAGVSPLVAAPASAATGSGPVPSLMKPVAVRAVGSSGRRIVPSAATAAPATRWPAASHGVARAAAGGQPVAVAGTAVKVATVLSGGSARDAAATGRGLVKGAQVSWSVGVRGQKDATAAGVHGVLMQLARTDHGPGAVRAKVIVDYSAFATAQADLGQRLRLVMLPACALTTPAIPKCQVQTALDTTNNSAAQTISATVPAMTGTVATTGTATTSTAGTANSAVGTNSVVIAAAATTAGPSGSFSATSLKPSGTWATSGASGSFQWQYPVDTPSAGYGQDVEPDLSVGYDSGAVDGQVAGENNQTSLVGEGWDSGAYSYIERSYRTCSDDTSLPSADRTGDLCWAGQVLTLHLKGQSNPIVVDDTNGSYHLEGDDGSRLQHLTGANNGARDGEYWRLTTPDGVQYTFGENVLPGGTTSNKTNSVQTVPVYGAHSGDPCYNATFADASCTQAYRWNLDMVQDPHRVTAIYLYAKSTNYYGQDGKTTPKVYDRYVELNWVEWGIPATATSVYAASPAYRVYLGYTQRCISTSTFSCTAANLTTANASHWPDVPIDQQCASTGTCNVHSPTFWTQYRLTSISTEYHSGTSWPVIDSYSLAESFPPDGNPQMDLDSITHTGHAGTATLVTPATTFKYAELDNRVQGYNAQPAMPFERLVGIEDEMGGTTQVFYNTMSGQSGRSKAVHRHHCAKQRFNEFDAVFPGVLDVPVQPDADAGLLQQVCRDPGDHVVGVVDGSGPHGGLQLLGRPGLALRRQPAGGGEGPHLWPVARLRPGAHHDRDGQLGPDHAGHLPARDERRQATDRDPVGDGAGHSGGHRHRRRPVRGHEPGAPGPQRDDAGFLEHHDPEVGGHDRHACRVWVAGPDRPDDPHGHDEGGHEPGRGRDQPTGGLVHLRRAGPPDQRFADGHRRGVDVYPDLLCPGHRPLDPGPAGAGHPVAAGVPCGRDSANQCGLGREEPVRRLHHLGCGARGGQRDRNRHCDHRVRRRRALRESDLSVRRPGPTDENDPVHLRHRHQWQVDHQQLHAGGGRPAHLVRGDRPVGSHGDGHGGPCTVRRHARGGHRRARDGRDVRRVGPADRGVEAGPGQGHQPGDRRVRVHGVAVGAVGGDGDGSGGSGRRFDDDGQEGHVV